MGPRGWGGPKFWALIFVRWFRSWPPVASWRASCRILEIDLVLFEGFLYSPMFGRVNHLLTTKTWSSNPSNWEMPMTLSSPEAWADSLVLHVHESLVQCFWTWLHPLTGHLHRSLGIASAHAVWEGADLKSTQGNPWGNQSSECPPEYHEPSSLCWKERYKSCLEDDFSTAFLLGSFHVSSAEARPKPLREVPIAPRSRVQGLFVEV